MSLAFARATRASMLEGCQTVIFLVVDGSWSYRVDAMYAKGQDI